MLELSRNPYDKISHFMQGFEPALLAREVLLRGQHVKGRKMLVFVILSIVLAFSAFYELIEWAPLWLWVKAPMSFWPLRVTRGTPNPTCCLPSLAQRVPWSPLADGTTDSCQLAKPTPPTDSHHWLTLPGKFNLPEATLNTSVTHNKGCARWRSPAGRL